MDSLAPDISAQLTSAYEQYAGVIFRYCSLHTFSSQEAEELTQETFLRTWEYLRAGRTVENMKTFLYRVAGNLLIDEARKRKRKEEISLESLLEKGFEPGKDDLDRMQKKLDIWKILVTLEEEEFKLLSMRYLQGMQPADIAGVTGVAANTIAVRLHRAIKRISQESRLLEQSSERHRETTRQR